MPSFDYTVDNENQTTDAHQLSANEILQHAGIDPATYYLIEIQGNHQVSYEGRGGDTIHIHEHQRFVSVFTGPTTVS